MCRHHLVALPEITEIQQWFFGPRMKTFTPRAATADSLLIKSLFLPSTFFTRPKKKEAFNQNLFIDFLDWFLMLCSRMMSPIWWQPGLGWDETGKCLCEPATIRRIFCQAFSTYSHSHSNPLAAIIILEQKDRKTNLQKLKQTFFSLTSAKKSCMASLNLTARLSISVLRATSHFPAIANSSEHNDSNTLEQASKTCTPNRLSMY